MAGWVGVNDADFLGVLERQPTIYKRKVPVWWVCYIEIQLGESILTPTHPTQSLATYILSFACT
jgi:hypothetical protein